MAFQYTESETGIIIWSQNNLATTKQIRYILYKYYTHNKMCWLFREIRISYKNMWIDSMMFWMNLSCLRVYIFRNKMRNKNFICDYNEKYKYSKENDCVIIVRKIEIKTSYTHSIRFLFLTACQFFIAKTFL